MTNWLPVFLFVILFGLSMDYHVFILTRVRELYDGGMSTDDAVREGISRTAGVVTSAAFVMVGVFGVFATLEFIDFKEMGVGLAAAVLIDATIIRGVCFRPTMKLLGDWNWYLPRSLHWLPAIRKDDRDNRRPLRRASARSSLLGSMSDPRPDMGRRSFSSFALMGFEPTTFCMASGCAHTAPTVQIRGPGAISPDNHRDAPWGWITLGLPVLGWIRAQRHALCPGVYASRTIRAMPQLILNTVTGSPKRSKTFSISPCSCHPDPSEPRKAIRMWWDESLPPRLQMPAMDHRHRQLPSPALRCL